MNRPKTDYHTITVKYDRVGHIFLFVVLKCCRTSHKFNSQLYNFALHLLSSIFNETWREREREREIARE